MKKACNRSLLQICIVTIGRLLNPIGRKNSSLHNMITTSLGKAKGLLTSWRHPTVKKGKNTLRISTGTIESPTDPNDQVEGMGITAFALYDYQAADTDEISFDPEDIVTNIEMIDEGWWRGWCNGQYGLFPANYVQVHSPTQ